MLCVTVNRCAVHHVTELPVRFTWLVTIDIGQYYVIVGSVVDLSGIAAVARCGLLLQTE